jgi:glycosyltransferase involved in cell wall biosynthesis
MEIFYNFSAHEKINEILKKEKINFIYERYAFFCWAGVKSAKEASIPIILEVNEISGIKRVRGQILKGVAKKIEINNFKQASAIVVVSEFLKQGIAQNGINMDKIHVIPNGVNPKVFNPDVDCTELIEKYQLKNKVVIGFAGGFVKWHNFDLLFNAFKKVRNQTDQGICLFLVGDGPLRKDLKQKVKALNLQDSVIFTERVPHGQVPVYIKAMDICVIIHTNEFGSPIKLFEYMAMGKSVIAPRLGPLEEVVTHNVNGCLFEKGNVEQVTEFLKELTVNKEFYKFISQNAKKSVLKNHLWEHNAKTILNVYNDLG